MTLESLQRMSRADFEAFVGHPNNADKRFELRQGVLIEMPAPSPLHAYIAGEIFAHLREFARQDQRGFAFGDNVSYTLSPDNELIPDVSFVSKTRQATLPAHFEIAPDLAVEVVSPSNRPRDLLTKVETYLEYGTLTVWVVYPDEAVVDVYQAAQGEGLFVRKFVRGDVLEGEGVLAGLRLPIDSLFPAP